MKQKPKTSKVSLGTLYDINKNAMKSIKELPRYSNLYRIGLSDKGFTDSEIEQIATNQLDKETALKYIAYVPFCTFPPFFVICL